MSYSKSIKEENFIKLMSKLKINYLILIIVFLLLITFISFYFYKFERIITWEFLILPFLVISSLLFIFYSIKIDYCWAIKKIKKFLFILGMFYNCLKVVDTFFSAKLCE